MDEATPTLRRQQLDAGFTLIELLVVIIIIGVLAAMAIPTLVHQRNKGWDIAVRSDLRNAAMAQDAIITLSETGFYAATPTELMAAGFRPSAESNYYGGSFGMTVSAAGSFYCLTARSQSGSFFGFSSERGPVESPDFLDPDTCL